MEIDYNSRNDELFKELRKCKPQSDEYIRIRNEIVMLNEGFVYWKIHDMQVYVEHCELSDLYIAGVLGLIKAIDTYDETQASFAVYAGWYIYAQVMQCIINDSMIRVPAHVHDHISKIRKSGMSVSDYCKKYKANKGVIHDGLRALHTTSLDAPTSVHDNEFDTVGFNVPNDCTPVEDCAIYTTTKALIDDLLSSCTPKEREFIDLYYVQGHTMAEIGKMYGVTKARTSQLLAIAMRKVRLKARRMKVAPDILGIFNEFDKNKAI